LLFWAISFSVQWIAMAKKTAKKTVKPKSTKKQKSKSATNATNSASHAQALRDYVLALLKDGGAHISFDDAVKNWPLRLAGVKVAKFPHTAWMLLEHMRIGQWDILEFSRNPKHVSPKWPDEYWPRSDAPRDEAAWTASIDAIKKDSRAIQQLVTDPKVNLFAKIPWGDGQTILREALLVADHNAYHLGQLMTLRKSLGI
jgi:hypothetical protein